jgi:hypothetical protein
MYDKAIMRSFDLQSYFANVEVLLTAVDEQARKRLQNALEIASRSPKPWGNSHLQSTVSTEAKRFTVAHVIPPLVLSFCCRSRVVTPDDGWPHLTTHF